MRWTKNVWERALSTLWQAFAASLPVTFVITGDVRQDLSALAAVGLAGLNAVLAAGLSAAKNATAEGAVVEAQRRCDVARPPAVDQESAI